MQSTPIRAGIFLGHEMHTKFDDGFYRKWNFPVDFDLKIEDFTHYVVIFRYDSWDYSGGLTGDSEGEQFDVIHVEPVAEHIEGFISQRDKLNRLIGEYVSGISEKYKDK